MKYKITITYKGHLAEQSKPKSIQKSVSLKMWDVLSE